MAGGNVQNFVIYFSQYARQDIDDSVAPARLSSDPSTVGFHWADYVVFAATLLIALGIGVVQAFTGDKQRTTKEYLMGNRNLSVVPVALSTFMSVISGILVLGTTAEMYMYGTQLWMDSVGRAFTYSISAYLFVPLMYELKLTSVFTYHQLRFLSEGLRLLCVVLAMLSSLLYMGLAMYAPATALEAVTGFPVWASLVCIGVVAVIYTTVGGIKAVVYTDFFQAFVLFGGLLAILIVGCIKVGGLDVVWQVSDDNGRIIFFNMDPDPTERSTFWTVIIGSAMLGLAQSGYEQTQIQRYCSLPTVNKAKLAVYLQIPLLLAVYVLVCLVGLTVFAYYELEGCDPLRSGLIDNSNQIVPWFMVDVLNAPGFPGLFVAVLFSGALSSVSSSMNSLAAITWKDICESRIKFTSEFRKAFFTKCLAFGFGTIGVVLGFMMQVLRGHVMQLSSAILGGLLGPLSAVVFAGALLPWITATGATIGVIAGIFMTSWINVGQFIHYPHRSYLETNVANCTHLGNATAIPIEEDNMDIFGLYQVSYLYIGFIGFGTTILVSLVTSFIFGANNPRDVDPRTLIDCGDRCGCCLSPRYREKCSCGIDFDVTDDNNDDGDDDNNEKQDIEMKIPDQHQTIERDGTSALTTEKEKALPNGQTHDDVTVNQKQLEATSERNSPQSSRKQDSPPPKYEVYFANDACVISESSLVTEL